MKKSPRTMQRRRFVTLLALGEALSSPLPLARRFALTRAGNASRHAGARPVRR